VAKKYFYGKKLEVRKRNMALPLGNALLYKFAVSEDVFDIFGP